MNEPSFRDLMTADEQTRTNYFDQMRAKKEEVLSAMPESAPCPRHPEMQCQRDDDESYCNRSPRFKKCDICQDEEREQHERERLREFGVPWSLCGSTFDNWKPADEQAEANLATVREFAEKIRRGELILLGDLGTGKTHLAAAALRVFKTALFVTQSQLLRKLRQTYHDRDADDPVESAQNVGCLVLDDMGLTSGGRDELPMLHDILDFRHGNQKATIITSNLQFDQLAGVIGQRMADRLRESTFAALTFGGTSHRRQARDRYFSNPRCSTKP